MMRSSIKYCLIFLCFLGLLNSCRLLKPSQNNSEIWKYKKCYDSIGTTIKIEINNDFIILPFSKEYQYFDRFKIDSLCTQYNLASDSLTNDSSKTVSIRYSDTVYSIILIDKKEVKYKNKSTYLYKFMISYPKEVLNEHFSWYVIYIKDIGTVNVYQSYNDDIGNYELYKLVKKKGTNPKLLYSLNEEILKKFIILDCW